MLAGLLLLLIAAIGASYGGIVIRAAPDRRDNLVFGVLVICDALMITWRAINVLSGETLVGDAVMMPCSLGTMVMAVLTIEFLYAFPRRRSLSWTARGAVIVWTLVAAAVIAFADLTPEVRLRAGQLIYYAPMTALVFFLAGRAAKSTTERAARVVVGMLCFRWAFGFFAFALGPTFGVFEQALWAETTFATLLSFVIIGTAVLRHNLFSMRSAAAEMILVSTMALAVVLSGGGTIFAVLEWTEPGSLQTALLVGATLVPLALASLARALYPRLEANVLAPLDDRRAKRLGVARGPLPVEPTAAIDEACRRIAEVGEGATVTWHAAADIDEPLARELRSGNPQQPERPGACFAVPVLGGERELVGAFMIEGGVIDRDTYLVARDLATHVALAVERARAVSELDDARRLAALGQFAAAIAHDIRTPLTSISLNVQILRRKLQLSDDDREHLDIALEELARLDKSVAEILDFAKPVKLAPQAIDVGELVETTTRGLTPVLSEKGVALQCEAADALPTVQGDPQRLRQVIVNLVGNAAEASTPGAAVTVRAKPAEGSHVAIEVEDKGRGIQANDLPRIFEPFFTTRPDGTGLGLAICHKVVRAHGGDIQVRSTPGAGSTFTILLPAA